MRGCLRNKQQGVSEEVSSAFLLAISLVSTGNNYDSLFLTNTRKSTGEPMAISRAWANRASAEPVLLDARLGEPG